MRRGGPRDGRGCRRDFRRICRPARFFRDHSRQDQRTAMRREASDPRQCWTSIRASPLGFISRGRFRARSDRRRPLFSPTWRLTPVARAAIAYRGFRGRRAFSILRASIGRSTRTHGSGVRPSVSLGKSPACVPDGAPSPVTTVPLCNVRQGLVAAFIAPCRRRPFSAKEHAPLGSGRSPDRGGFFATAPVRPEQAPAAMPAHADAPRPGRAGRLFADGYRFAKRKSESNSVCSEKAP